MRDHSVRSTWSEPCTGRGPRSGRGGCAAYSLDHRDHGADSDRLTLGGDDPRQAPGDGRDDLSDRLLDVDVDERLALDHLVALALQPLDDRPLLHPHPELRQA